MVIIPKTTFNNLGKEKQDRIITAAISEFSKRSFEEAKLSNIIKDSQIPRGSFYQYFTDKKDLYLHIFEIIKIKKLEYLKDLLPNEQEIPFLDLFGVLYKQGLKFAIDHPEFVEIYRTFISSKGVLYNELMGDGLKLARDYYIGYINADKAKGIIRDDVDAMILADLVINLTTNIAIDEFASGDIDYEKLLSRIDNLINIFRKGVE